MTLSRSASSVIPVDDTEHEGRVSTKQGIFVNKEGHLKFVCLVVKYPYLVFLATLAIALGGTIALGQTVFKAGNPITEDTSAFDLKDIRSVAYDSFRLASGEVRNLRDEQAKSVLPILVEEGNNGEDGASYGASDGPRPQESLGDVTYWIFESKGPEGVFGSRSSLRIMKSAETMFTADENYPEYCQLAYDQEGNATCMKPFSAMNSYFASQWNSTIAQRVIEQLSDPGRVGLYNSLALCIEYGMQCDFVPQTVTPQDFAWANELNADIMSIVVHWDGEGRLNKNIDEVTSFHAHIRTLVTKSPLVNFFFDKNFGVNNTRSMYSRSIVFWGSPLTPAAAGGDEVVTSRSGRSSSESDTDKRKDYILRSHLDDMDAFAAPGHNAEVRSYYFQPSLVFDVIVEILASDALRAILSFCLVFAYLRLMVGSWFLASVGMLEILLSVPLAWLCFSAVFQIKYFSSLNVLCLFIVAAIGADDIFVFMDAYKQSANQGKEVLQSLEARLSWVYRRAGGAMAITSATTCSAFLCTMASPIAGTKSFGLFAALVILFDYILVMSLFCTSVVIYHNRFERPGSCCFGGCCSQVKPSPTEQALARLDSKQGGAQEEERINHFFRTKVSGFVLQRRNRLLLAIPFVLWLRVACFFTSRLEPTRTSEQALSEDHPLQRSANILREHFLQTEQDTATKVQFAVGVGDVDRTGVSQLFDPDYTGAPTFVDTFAFTEQCQQVLLDTCDTLKNVASFEAFIKRDKEGTRAVKCFVEEFSAYSALGNLKDCNAVKSGKWKATTNASEAWQIPAGNVDEVVADFISQDSCYGGDETVISYYGDEIGWDGTNLRYAAFSVESKVIDPWGTLPEEVVREQYDAWMAFKTELDSKTEKHCGSTAIVTDSDQKFIFMNNQRIYRTSAISGSLLGVAIAFVVLLISTRRLHIALAATTSIMCVLISVIGTVTWMGWTLGTNEAILISILAGFSVDYVVHLAHAYCVAKGNTADRLRSAFGDMGVSVLSGMVTSVVASIPLFLCTLTFFAKFGTFLCLTIAFSWLFANLFFTSVVAQANISMDGKKWR